ncbi:developmental pluripotency-associated protein 3 [Sciurus carolinensis]|uniref:developmental pluripotency-associated protein 3 n=1 Tax=Sciurus carolinensis TaxID=30640 RepID=UPI001FB2B818|nr:developmental pluripotency-associated protein 3 [Sciurus carolinensis]
MSENEENFPEDSVDSHPVNSEMLTKQLHNLTLNPCAKRPSPLPEGPPQPQDRSERILREVRRGFPYRRRGVRTLLSARKERVAKWRYLLSVRFSQLEREQQRTNNLKGVQSESRSVPFKCTCSYCVYHGWDPSENARIGYDYDTESI